MTLGIRKLIIVGLVGAVFLMANFLLVASWLQEKGIIGWTQGIRKEYLTGTAITIIIVLLILLVKPGTRAVSRLGLGRRCPVCDHRLLGRAVYCGDCGSKA